MSELNKLALRYEIDKADRYVHGGHDYARRYEPLFQALKDSVEDRPVKVLEIGVGSGGCLRVWLDFFSTMQHRADVYGVDNNPVAIVNIEKQKWDVKVSIGDATNVDFWVNFVAKSGSDFDLIIDDGSHYSEHIITTFGQVWPLVRSGGLYVCEDLHCSYQSFPFNTGGPRSMDFFRSAVDVMNDQGADMNGSQTAGNQFDWIHFSKSFVVIKKR